MEETLERLEQKFDDLKDQIEGKAEETKTELQEVKRDLRAKGRENPLTAMSVALGVGVVVGFILTLIF